MDATIKDIAQLAGVSYTTVSRALNDKRGVNQETRRKILEVAQRLNYRPNAIARGLVKKQTHSIGLVIPDITNPFFPEVARGIEDGASEAGYSIFLCNTNWEHSKEAGYINLLVEKRVDGIVLAPISPKVDFLPEALSTRVPVVYVDKVPKDGGGSFVTIDNVRGGFLATKHLIDRGYHEIGFIGAPDDSSTIDDRLRGYRMALKKHGIAVNQRYVRFGDFKLETGYNIIKKMIQDKDYPRALFAENDLLALGILQGAKEMGLSVPGDIAVVGFDDIPIASFPEVQLTTVCQPKYKMGRIAVEILLDKIERGDQAARRKFILEPELIQRKSS
jgi:LacI family transcriptional regulator